jgi:signal transduction histidine kinase
MSDPVWYRSLYWRIALGFVALLAVLLSTQVLLFLWLTGRVAAVWPGRSASELATAIATDLSQTLNAQPSIDLGEYVNRKYSSAFRSFFIVMRDGRVAFSRRVGAPPGIERAASTRLFGDSPLMPRFPRGRGGPDRGGFGAGGDFPRRPDGGGGDFSRRPPDAGGFGRGGRPPGDPPGPGGFGGPGQRYEFGSVTASGAEIGIVAVPFDPPPLSVAMRDLGPTLAFAGVGLLLAGTAIGALLVFRPTHRRLSALQEAARALGSGETSIRAPESGGDEVTALAHAFNEMAGQLEQRTNALESADRARRQLVADVSHELTTPLAAIRGYVETLAMPDLSLDDSTRSRYLQIVMEETDRLGHIVGDLLDVARLEGGGGSLSRETVSVGRLFERLRDRHAQVLQDKDIALDLRAHPETLTVRADPKRIEQVLQNLVSNAARHTPDGGRISVSAEETPTDVVISVQDTGPGIPPEHLDRVFDRFYKVDVSRTGTTVPSGSGLGLSIVRAIVERHGGRVTASNGPNGGACFTVTLPAGSKLESSGSASNVPHDQPEHVGAS